MNNDNLDNYRKSLNSLEQKSQESYDKTVLMLSSGALAVSITLIKDFLGVEELQSLCLLFMAWIAWCSSVTSVLLSHYFSRLAVREAIKQVDNDKIYKENAGGRFDKFTASLNNLSGLFFILGLFLLIFFIFNNLENRYVQKKQKNYKCHKKAYGRNGVQSSTTTTRVIINNKEN